MQVVAGNPPFFIIESTLVVIFNICCVMNRNYKPQSEELEPATLPLEAPADVEMLVKTQLEDGEKAKEEVQVCPLGRRFWDGSTHLDPQIPTT